MNKMRAGCFLLAVLVLVAGVPPARLSGQDQVEKPKIFRDVYPIVVETDLYCSFFLLEQEPPLRIIEPADDRYQLLLTDGLKFWAGPGGGLREGQLLQILEIGPHVAGTKGNLGLGRGRAKVLRVQGDRFLAQIEKSCGAVRTGNILLPFEIKEIVMGRDLGFDGKSLIHPNQISAANATFAPDAAEIAAAHEIISAFEQATAQGKGVVVVNDRLVENLHVEEAQRQLALAAAIARLG